MTEEDWNSLSTYKQYLWFSDEVEARWQRLKQMHPNVAWLEVEWSKADKGSYERMLKEISGVLGFEIAEMQHLRHHIKSVWAKNPQIFKRELNELGKTLELTPDEMDQLRMRARNVNSTAEVKNIIRSIVT